MYFNGRVTRGLALLVWATISLGCGGGPTDPDQLPPQCDQPASIANGSITVSEKRAGDEAEYRCDNGFEMVGSSNSVCQNTNQWVPEQPTCVDIDECAENNGGCGDAAYIRCVNNEGAAPDCIDVDECAENNGGCEAPYYACVNNRAAPPSCTDINECAENNGGCAAPGYACVNNDGAPPSCVDIDECAENNGGCGSADENSCTNTQGGHLCNRILDITDFGATANDDQDDRTAIQAAIDASDAGDQIIVPAGRFRISGTIQLLGERSFAGVSNEDSILEYTGDEGQPALNIAGGIQRVRVANIRLEGAGRARSGLEALRSSGHVLDNLSITEATNFGIRFIREVTDSLITNNHISRIGTANIWGAGMRIAHQSSRNRILGNVIRDTGRGGILANDGSTDLVIRDNVVSGSGLATDHNGAGLGIEVWTDCDRAVIEDNTIDHWLSVDGSSFCAVRRNVVSDRTGRYKAIGIEFAVAGENCVFVDNQVLDGQKSGLSISNRGVRQYMYFGHNRFERMIRRGGYMSGLEDGLSKFYFFANEFLNTRNDHELLGELAPPNQGNGLVIHGYTSLVTFEANRFENNALRGIVLYNERDNDHDGISFVDNHFVNNGWFSVHWNSPATNVKWDNNTVSGNCSRNTPENCYNIELETTGFENQKPTAAFAAAEQVVVGERVAFTNSSSDPDGRIVHHLWDLGDDVPVTDAQPSHAYTRPGDYRVTLLVWDDGGRGARAEQIIRVVEAP